MAYDVSALTDYVNEQNFPLIRKALFGAKTAGLINMQTGVKSATALNLLDDTIVFQDDGCSRIASGSSAITQRNIEVGEIAVHKDFCPKDLEKKALQTQVKAGSVQDELTFEEELMGQVTAGIAKTLEKAIWQATGSASDPNLNKFEGLIANIDNSGVAIDGNTSAVSASVGITKSNIEQIIDDIYVAIPEDIIDHDDVGVFMGIDTFRTYTQALKDSNLFHFNPDAAADFEYVIPGTNVRLYGVHGLNGTNRLFAGKANHMFVGVDLENEEEEFEVWYSQDDRTVKLTNAFKYGTQVAFPDQIVEWSLVP